MADSQHKTAFLNIKASGKLFPALFITGADKGSCFIAKSLRDEDCFSRSKDVHIISHIFMKQNDEKKYKCELYHEKNTSTSDLPENIKELLSPELTEKI
ncbi:MAG: hypothetical protein MJ188_11125 [Treponema sp.]|nr:hypothetical protein [Treponema sp.]